MATAAQPLFDMSKAVPIAAPKPLFDMSKAVPIDESTAQPAAPTGILAGLKRNTMDMVSGLFHAFTDPATDEEKQALLDQVKKRNANGENVPESTATDPSTATLAYQRIMAAPSQALDNKGMTEQQAAKDLLSKGKYWTGANEYLSGTTDRFLSAIPLAGPWLNSVAERAERGDFSGAATDVASAVALMNAGKASSAISDKLPSFERASGNFEALKGSIGEHTVPMTNELSNALSELKEGIDTGLNAPSVINKFVTRIADTDQPPLTYSEARQFYSNVGDLSASDKMAANGKMVRLLNNFKVALGNSIEQTARDAGRLDQYRSAMKEYRQASSVQNAVKVGTKAATRGAITAAGGATAYAGYRTMSDMLGK